MVRGGTTRRMVATIGVAVLVLTLSAPAGAAEPEAGVIQPDAIVLKNNGTGPAGDNVYNDDGLNQTRVRGVARGGTANFLFRMQNDSDTTQFLTPDGCSGNIFFRVRYFIPGTPDIDVTATIADGLLSVGRNPQQTETYRVAIKAKASAPVGAVYQCRLKVTINRKGPDDPVDVALIRVIAN